LYLLLIHFDSSGSACYHLQNFTDNLMRDKHLDLTTLFDPILSELKKIEQQLIASVESKHDSPEIQAASAHILKAGGKRLRPALLLLVAHLGDYDADRAIKAGTVVEQIHLATLIHDDVVDKAELRRGASAINKKWDNKFAVLLGDYLYSSAFLSILDDPDLRIVEAVVNATKEMTRGELLQAVLNGNPAITEEEYSQVIEGKTACLVSACCRIGACIAGFEPDQVALLTEYGYHLGMAFQLTDDILDVVSSSKKLGKAAGNDARKGVYTLPLIISIKRATIKDRKHLLKLLKTEVDNYVWANISEYISRYDGVEYSLFLAKDHILRAHKCLDAVSFGDTTTLHSIADYIVSRDF